MRSLLAPLVTGLLLSLVMVFGVQWSMVKSAVDALMIDYIANELAQDADEIFGSLTVLPDGAATLALTHFDPPFLRPYSGRYFQVLVGDRTVLKSPSLAADSLRVVAAGAGQRRVEQIGGPQRQSLLLSASGYDFRGRAVTVAVADDLKPVRLHFQQLMARYTSVSLMMFAALVVLQVLIVRLVLAPLRAVRADVARLERGEITQLGVRVPAELLPLVREVNRLLSLLATRLQRSRESLGNLTHALKAPLTVLMQMTGDARIQGDAAFAAQMREQLELLRGRVESELRRARVAGGGNVGTALDIGSELQSLLATMRKLYRERALDISCRVDDGARFQGDREDFLELTGNLLDNACKWARSCVRVSVRPENGLLLTVEDDGPGCSPEGLERITQRGVRLDESTQGHGLGLSIVRSIAASYGAALHFGRSRELGGLEVSVNFPPPR